MSEAVTTKPRGQQAQAPSVAEKYANSPWRDPVKFLLDRGWEPTGDPHQPGCAWYDPQAPLKDVEEKVPVFVPSADGKRQVPVMVKDKDGKPIQSVQTKVTPRRFAMSRAEAIEVQQGREKGA